MSKQTINIGASPNDGTGTPLRTSFDYTNQNFTELYTALGGGVGLPGATTQVIFNDGGTNLAGDAGLVYNKTTDALTVAGLVTAGSATITGDLTVDTSTLKVDSTNDRVGIATATPGVRVDIVSDSNTSLAPVLRVNSNNVAVSTALAYDGLIASGGMTLQAGTSASIVFNTNGATERARFNSTGNLAFVTGKGIDFSAVTGGTGTATANVLNDYEEGTWQGTLTGGGGATNPTTPVIATGRYTKIGRVVTVQISYSNATTTGASGAIAITGLPFANNSAAQSNGAVSLYQIGTFTGSPFAIIDGAASSIDIQSNISGATYGSVTHNAGIARYMTISITYTVA